MKTYNVTVASDMTRERRVYTINATEIALACGRAKALFYDDTGYAGHVVAHSRVR